MKKEKSVKEKIESLEGTIKELNEKIEKAEEEGSQSFLFQEQEVIVDYARYLVEYLVNAKRAFEMKR